MGDPLLQDQILKQACFESWAMSAYYNKYPFLVIWPSTVGPCYNTVIGVHNWEAKEHCQGGK